MIQKTLDKVSGYLYSIQFDYTTLKYYAQIALPVHWVVKTLPDVQIFDHNISDENIFFKMKSNNIDNVIDNLAKIIKHNTKVDEMEQKLREKIAEKKRKINLEEQNLSQVVSKMKKDIATELEDDLYKVDAPEEIRSPNTGYTDTQTVNYGQEEYSGHDERLE
jgi:vacuolar-type H+-ATPase subunit I/STV1